MIATLEWMLTKEAPGQYDSRNRFIYEVVLKTADQKAWLKTPENAQRLLQALMLLQKMLEVEWLDVLMWQDGLYLRLKLGQASSLLEVLNLLRKKSAPTTGGNSCRWEDEPTWVRMVTPERAEESNRLLWEKVDSLMASIRQTPEQTHALFFYHQEA